MNALLLLVLLCLNIHIDFAGNVFGKCNKNKKRWITYQEAQKQQIKNDQKQKKVIVPQKPIRNTIGLPTTK